MHDDLLPRPDVAQPEGSKQTCWHPERALRADCRYSSATGRVCSFAHGPPCRTHAHLTLKSHQRTRNRKGLWCLGLHSALHTQHCFEGHPSNQGLLCTAECSPHHQSPFLHTHARIRRGPEGKRANLALQQVPHCTAALRTPLDRMHNCCTLQPIQHYGLPGLTGWR